MNHVKLTLQEILYFLIINFIILFIPFLLSKDFFYFIIIGLLLSLYPFIIANFIGSYFYWKKCEQKNIFSMIAKRTLFLIIGFAATYFVYYLLNIKLNLLMVLLLFVSLWLYTVVFILFKHFRIKNNILTFILLLMVFSCTKKDDCNNSIEIYGKYENTYEQEAKDYLTMNKNGTFEQIYIKGSIIKKNKGTWKFFKDDCSIYFKTLKLLHNLPPQSKEESVEGQPAKFRNNKIMFYEDMPFEYDYTRIQD